jgi:hypothetical protein
MVVLPLSPRSSYITVESINMMNSGKVWDKMVWSSSHLQQLSTFCEKWSRQLESWNELFKWVTDTIRFLLNRNTEQTYCHSLVNWMISLHMSSHSSTHLHCGILCVFSFQFLILFSSFRHFLLIFGPTCCSYSSSLWKFSIFKLSDKDPYGWVLRSDESIPFTVKSWKYTKEKQFKESSVVGMCIVIAASCTISMKKVNVITMESDLMRSRCYGYRPISDGLIETMCKDNHEVPFFLRFIRVFQEIIPHQKRLGRKFGKPNPKQWVQALKTNNSLKSFTTGR